MIEFKNVEKIYSNNVRALQNINLTINQGEFVAIIGLSGAGKSTLIRCINRMHDITSGQLFVNGMEVSSLKGGEIRKFRKRIGMIFQSFNLVTRMSVLNNVLVSFVPELPFWRKLTGVFPKEYKIRALSALEQVGILDKAFVRVDQLSGGQQQRVALARTLAQNPEIILADEPIASLDPVTGRQVLNDFKRINQEMELSVIMNIHHVEIALEYANRIIGVREGQVVFDGKVEAVTQEVLDYIYNSHSKEGLATSEGETVHV
ncbi:phosphonate ABC transporter ATP-binding protein [Ornithinibacillus sp. BX22]|uniref:Phosphonate ABC transporter ATP-binding protein n=2 Tax=Ornithinibacillus TaxID=484508 RepID=A0A923RLD0_9BACI|nr:MULTISPECIES: phosphonate ABC transporter ATP-binding protein [Ornithinibacillus]MBC5637987.1 phosphonate ABC transporter ATP-binding protein [Ornithinibacillus hominis]MBS3681875.1 phosphonate ABC transporter ATP-binding protein [Ornithinibacillus massiliensis]